LVKVRGFDSVAWSESEGRKASTVGAGSGAGIKASIDSGLPVMTASSWLETVVWVVGAGDGVGCSANRGKKFSSGEGWCIWPSSATKTLSEGSEAIWAEGWRLK